MIYCWGSMWPINTQQHFLALNLGSALWQKAAKVWGRMDQLFGHLFLCLMVETLIARYHTEPNWTKWFDRIATSDRETREHTHYFDQSSCPVALTLRLIILHGSYTLMLTGLNQILETRLTPHTPICTKKRNIAQFKHKTSKSFTPSLLYRKI